MRAAPVFQKVDNAIHWLYPVDSGIGFPNTYPLDSDLSGEYIALSNIWTTGTWSLSKWGSGLQGLWPKSKVWAGHPRVSPLDLPLQERGVGSYGGVL